MNRLIIDCNNLCHISFHSMPNLKFEYRETGIIYGFLKQILNYSEKFDSTSFYFTWDSKRSFRKEVYPKYKEKRDGKKKELDEDEKDKLMKFYVQMKEIRRKILGSIGFRNVFVSNGLEGDDLIAILARMFKEMNKEAIVISSDNDLLQLLNYIDMIYNPQNKKSMNTKQFKRVFGYDPSWWAIAKAIGGCDSDEVKGVKGVADPKKVSSNVHKWLLGKLTKGVVYDRIEKEKKKLMKINYPLVKLPYKEVNMILRRDCINEERLFDTFSDLNFNSFLKEKEYKRWKRFIKKGEK